MQLKIGSKVHLPEGKAISFSSGYGFAHLLQKFGAVVHPKVAAMIARIEQCLGKVSIPTAQIHQVFCLQELGQQALDSGLDREAC